MKNKKIIVLVLSVTISLTIFSGIYVDAKEISITRPEAMCLAL